MRISRPRFVLGTTEPSLTVSTLGLRKNSKNLQFPFIPKIKDCAFYNVFPRGALVLVVI